MNRDKYDLYNKAIEILGIDDLRQVFLIYLIEMLYHTMTFNGTKTEENENKWIEILAGVKMIIEIIVLNLEKTNKDQALWTAMHTRMDNLKEILDSKEREQEDNG